MREGFNEVIPGKLYQRGEFLKWPAQRKREHLQARGIDVVLNLWGKIDSDLEDFIYLSWPGIRSNDYPVELVGVLENVTPMLDNHCLLVHCEAGRGRSVFTSAYLAGRYLGLSADEALAYVYERVPGHNVNPKLEAFLGEVL